MNQPLVTVVLLTYISGHGLYGEPGQEISIPASVARRLIASGQAEPVHASAETHAIEVQHRTVQRRRQRASTQ